MSEETAVIEKKVVVLSNKRKLELFDHFCSTLVKCMCVEDVVSCLRGSSYATELYDTGVSADDIMRELLEVLEEEELDLVLQKNLPALMEEDLQAQKVTIKW